jgi:hypothetical protein
MTPVCGWTEDPQAEYFAAVPIFMDINLSRPISDDIRLSCLGRIGLRTYSGHYGAIVMCGLKEKHFPCINTGISLAVTAELTF